MKLIRKINMSLKCEAQNSVERIETFWFSVIKPNMKAMKVLRDYNFEPIQGLG